jgi:hypothetical protein
MSALTFLEGNRADSRSTGFDSKSAIEAAHERPRTFTLANCAAHGATVESNGNSSLEAGCGLYLAYEYAMATHWAEGVPDPEGVQEYTVKVHRDASGHVTLMFPPMVGIRCTDDPVPEDLPIGARATLAGSTATNFRFGSKIPAPYRPEVQQTKAISVYNCVTYVTAVSNSDANTLAKGTARIPGTVTIAPDGTVQIDSGPAIYGDSGYAGRGVQLALLSDSFTPGLPEANANTGFQGPTSITSGNAGIVGFDGFTISYFN